MKTFDNDDFMLESIHEEKQIEKLKAYKQALISEVVTKGLDSNISMKDSGVEWIGYIPKHWKKSKIKYLIDWIGSGTTPSNDQMLYYKDDINWIQSGDLYQKKFNLKKFQRTKKIKEKGGDRNRKQK